MLLLAVSLFLPAYLCPSNEGQSTQSNVTCLRIYNCDITTCDVVTFMIHVDIIKCRYSRYAAYSKTVRVDHYEIDRQRVFVRCALLEARCDVPATLSRKIMTKICSRLSCRSLKGRSCMSAKLFCKVSVFQAGQVNLE